MRKTVIRINGIQVSHRFSSRIEEIECETDKHFLSVDPSVQAAEHQTKALGDRKRTQAVGDRERQVETDYREWPQPFTEGLTVDRQVRQTSLQHFFLPCVLQRNLLRQCRGKAQCIQSFSERPELRSKHTY